MRALTVALLLSADIEIVEVDPREKQRVDSEPYEINRAIPYRGRG
jgi:hypothetical protein